MGQRYRLRFRTLAVTGDGADEALVELPAGSEVTAVEDIDEGSPDIKRQIKIKCLGRILKIFAIDLRIRGRRIVPPSR